MTEKTLYNDIPTLLDALEGEEGDVCKAAYATITALDIHVMMLEDRHKKIKNKVSGLEQQVKELRTVLGR